MPSPRPPAEISRLDQVTRKSGYSKIASKTSGVSPKPVSDLRWAKAATRTGIRPLTHCTMSISCASRFVVWPPE